MLSDGVVFKVNAIFFFSFWRNWKKSCICSVFKLFEIRLSRMKVDADYFKWLPFLVAKKLMIQHSFLYGHFVFLWNPEWSSSNISANKWFGNACQSRWPQISSLCACYTLLLPIRDLFWHKHGPCRDHWSSWRPKTGPHAAKWHFWHPG